ncbi:uncharacterized protein K452DRAFT_283700 [Aplosporella prunicola CBS 121167]|uniref:Cytochrome P450 n=1 Tax=Aplosporella prunicola CBS 121167 TaxID=1176127 RepID=A0A6A6BMJ2_9PEZI|nr:uncharacterized protein K452DRAFT_283700 [Aplosporella prunicola CBS 121167]KAF2145342.1 hypothetical protein K452DRAFT_283700 [Aplosporella prunicola CBS 121167]
MAVLTSVDLPFPPALVFLGVAVVALACRIVYNIYFHPLSKFPGPWYATSTSLTSALISVAKVEPQWLLSLVNKYGTHTPIRVAPQMLLMPMHGALEDIYWDKHLNRKANFYGSGALGPPQLFSTLDGEEHRRLRAAFGGQQWTIGSLKNHSEPLIDDLVKLFTKQMTELATTKKEVQLGEWLAWFAADVMSRLAFGEAFGFVESSGDHLKLLDSWRQGLRFFGLASRWTFLNQFVLKLPFVSSLLLPKSDDKGGMGWLMHQATVKVNQRELEVERGTFEGEQDLLQHCLEARMKGGEPVPKNQKIAHVTLLIQAGVDTTGTGLGNTMRYLLTNPTALRRAQQEIAAADAAGKLSTPIKYEETLEHLPYFGACIKEALRLSPPVTNLFARVVPPEGKVVQGHYIPPGTDVTSYAMVVQRDPEMYERPLMYDPERWLVSKEKTRRMEAASFVFGTGPRICLGKEIALMEMHKVLPEIIRRFDFELLDEGKFTVTGGTGWNEGFNARLSLKSLGDMDKGAG